LKRSEQPEHSMVVAMKRMNKAKKIYIIMGIALPIAFSVIVLALISENYLFAGIIGVASATWGALAFYLSRESQKCIEQNRDHLVMAETPRNLRRKRLAESANLFILLIAVIFLVMAVIFNSRLYFVLVAVWWILIHASEIIFVSIITDKSLYTK